MCISTDISSRLHRKPLLNNEHDYSLYINDEYDMDLSEYCLIDPKPQDMLMEEQIQEKPQMLDDTQNFDAPVARKKIRRYACPVCKRLWPTPSKLERHMVVHRKELQHLKQEPKDPEVQCPICFEPFETQLKLTEHMKIHQRVNDTAVIPKVEKVGSVYTCSVCGQDFSSPARVQNHMKSQHIRKITTVKVPTDPKVPVKSEVPIKNSCVVCGKSFPNPSKLLRHMHVHTKSKKEAPISKPRRYECEICLKKFETPSKLQRHQESSVHRDRVAKGSDGCYETPLVLEISAVTSILGD
jgi:Zinc finger, C2H2 type/C2H2-type zinc finger